MNIKKLLDDASPGKWKIRRLMSGTDFFIQAERLNKTDAYDIEVMGDEDYSTKLKDAELIVTLQNNALKLFDSWIKVDITPTPGFYVVSCDSDNGRYVLGMEFDGENWIYEGEPLFSRADYLEVEYYQTILPKVD